MKNHTNHTNYTNHAAEIAALYTLGRSADASALLASIIRTPNKGSALEQANKLLLAFGTLRGVCKAGVAEMVAAGLSRDKALAVKAAIESGRMFLEEPTVNIGPFNRSAEVHKYFAPRFKGAEQEVFYALLFDQHINLIREVRVSEGTINSCKITPTDVFSVALREKAVSMIVVHNHPSGKPEPSPEDRALTERLQQVAHLVGIKLLDHVVIGDGTYVSFADRDWL